ncbi:MAG: PLP-dependent aminotransferase family protein [Desulfobulbus sp.]|jgi:2-aminoadipate transaminase|uniref:aminotransferase-like domain-containing protein n=1 Tax=Desulfobulbus sp. TaxID=895 RepID=UPI0028469CC0|nr:PLP-dependent aminotransferase family protein [Desulfobulbus sp.]MDR2550880.1 PLP-dependent aminotransferase family protein [Desulfobulbus sp.]
MENAFSDRITDVPKSFIREILKVTIDNSIISFAGGLPNRQFFPVKGLQQAANDVFEEAGNEILQYANSEGYLGLRQFIADRYRQQDGLEIPVEDILITTGSQQGLDLLGKTFLNEGDDLIIEEPGYLGAIQAFSLYRPRFHPVPVSEGGMDIDVLAQVLQERQPKLLYTVTNFQNPSGISYPDENRRAVARLIDGRPCLIIQDDPYGDLRFTGSRKISFKRLLPENTVLLGSFSKIVAPALRLGWLVARPQIMEKVIVAKQAADLHTDYLAQRILHRFLRDNDIDAHIATIVRQYGKQKEAMVDATEQFFPDGVQSTNPDGGMFLWVTLPEGLSSMRLFEAAIAQKVAFVPGTPFYVDRKDTNTLRLNFSCSDEPTIAEGIRRLGASIKNLL